MTTISAVIDENLKDKLSSKATKEGKSISELVKEGLNSLDLDKKESNEVGDKSGAGGEKETTPSIPKELDNLSEKIGEIEGALIELGKAEACLGEMITRQMASHEKRRIDDAQREDANRTYLHNLIIDALEKTANKNLGECRGHHPRLAKNP